VANWGTPVSSKSLAAPRFQEMVQAKLGSGLIQTKFLRGVNSHETSSC
jgi:hypothetical protein